MSDSDQQRAQRYRVGGLRVVYDTGDGFWSAEVVDVSESGLFVETTHELAAGTRVTLLPEDRSDAELPFEVLAEVVRTNVYDLDNHFDRTPGIAFRWIDITDAERELVRNYLRGRGRPIAT